MVPFGWCQSVSHSCSILNVSEDMATDYSDLITQFHILSTEILQIPALFGNWIWCLSNGAILIDSVHTTQYCATDLGPLIPIGFRAHFPVPATLWYIFIHLDMMFLLMHLWIFVLYLLCSCWYSNTLGLIWFDRLLMDEWLAHCGLAIAVGGERYFFDSKVKDWKPRAK